MSQKKATYLSLILMILIALFFLNESLKLMQTAGADAIGPGYLPFWLSIILIILCGISFVKTRMKEKEEKVSIPNLKYIAATAVIIVLFCFSWSQFGLFYVHCFVVLTLLYALYRLSLGWTGRNIALILVVATGFTGFVYVLFEIIFKIEL